MKNKTNKKEEGVVLLIVVLILLVITVTGVYTVAATTSELAGAGASRNAYQASEAAKSMVEGTIDYSARLGPSNLYKRASQFASSFSMRGSESPDALSPGMIGFRLYNEEISDEILVVDSSSINGGSTRAISGAADVYDFYRYQGDMPGVRSDGYGNSYYMKTTITGRAKIRVIGLEQNQEINNFHTTDSAARANITLGPFNP